MILDLVFYPRVSKLVGVPESRLRSHIDSRFPPLVLPKCASEEINVKLVNTDSIGDLRFIFLGKTNDHLSCLYTRTPPSLFFFRR